MKENLLLGALLLHKRGRADGMQEYFCQHSQRTAKEWKTDKVRRNTEDIGRKPKAYVSRGRKYTRGNKIFDLYRDLQSRSGRFSQIQRLAVS